MNIVSDSEASLLYHREWQTRSLGCADCRDLEICGGLFVGNGLFSCLSFCNCVGNGGGSYVCPCNTEDFVNRIREVKGLGLENVKRVQRLNYPNLPLTIPLIYGSSRRTGTLVSSAIALPLNRLFDRKTGQLKFRTREDLARRFGFDASAKILISGVGKDQPIEDYWSHRQTAGLIDQIAKLGPDLVTVPNYSLFLNVPRWDNLHNMKRIALCWSELVSAGIPTSLHLNARTDRDWERWTEFVASREEIKSVSFEFATPAHVDRLKWHTDKLTSLAATVKRDLQIVVRGGCMHLRQLDRAFRGLVFVDTNPFVKTFRRRRLYWRLGRKPYWRPSLTPVDYPLDELLQHNVETSSRMVTDRLSLLW